MLGTADRYIAVPTIAKRARMHRIRNAIRLIVPIALTYQSIMLRTIPVSTGLANRIMWPVLQPTLGLLPAGEDKCKQTFHNAHASFCPLQSWGVLSRVNHHKRPMLKHFGRLTAGLRAVVWGRAGSGPQAHLSPKARSSIAMRARAPLRASGRPNRASSRRAIRA